MLWSNTRKGVDPRKPQLWRLPFVEGGFPMYLDGQVIYEGDFASVVCGVSQDEKPTPVYLVRENGERVLVKSKRWGIDPNGDAAVFCESKKG